MIFHERISYEIGFADHGDVMNLGLFQHFCKLYKK